MIEEDGGYAAWLDALPKQPDDNGVYRDADNRRWVLDGETYRALPHGHPDLNPFDGYKPIRPFKIVNRPPDPRYKKTTKRLIDGNGVFVNTQGTVRRTCYKDAPSYFKLMAGPSGAMAKPQKLYLMLVDPMRGDEVAKDFFDDQGRVLPHKFKPFYQFLCQRIATDDRCVTRFWEQLRDRWYKDPMATLEWVIKLFPTDAVQLIAQNLTHIGSITLDASDDKAEEIRRMMKVVPSQVIHTSTGETVGGSSTNPDIGRGEV